MSINRLPAAVLLLAAALGSAQAHHSFAAEFDIDKPVKLAGKVTRWEMVNPHSWIHLEVKGEAWAIEAGSPNALLRLGFHRNSLPPGTEVVVQGYRSKDGENKAVGADLTFPDGRRLFLRAQGEK